MFAKTRSVARKYGAKVAAVATLGALSVPAFAQSTNPIVQMLDAIGLDGVAAAVIAMGLIIVGIALAFKSPDVAKRGVKKI
ncbi:hypothetical protein N5D63_06040 [Comamonas thiooxydans]|uniref:Uncharacterized protein n=1 Tax=Comamonas thiooxydans TaxID=363952 RepID=A0AA42TRQ8_9BURK|nr:TrbC/VirB2 family protein [Comamonas thiooxydans]MDH1333706.1 hypothetical protein [Comamonas thiooxydans]MDH1739222.1 hypothetical protein [Comamonas thiooxydans]